jgi:DNA polymerase I
MFPGFDEAPQPAVPEYESMPAAPPGSGVASPTPESLTDRTVWVVDSHSLIHQVFHALPEMSSPSGQQVSAVYGFTRDLLYLVEDKRPDYLFCAFDVHGKTFRHGLYESYKGTRSAMPENLVSQIPLIYQMVAALGIPALGVESYEADDILATLARITDERGGRCMLVTADKDCRQLLRERVEIYNIRKNEYFKRDALQAVWGVAPEQVVDFMAMVGDSTDNVPGVPGIGPKAAQQLLEKYGSLDSILEHAGEITAAARRENLVKFRDQALLSRDLVRLDTHVPVAIDWDAGRPGHRGSAHAAKLFEEFGFRRMAEKLAVLGAR